MTAGAAVLRPLCFFWSSSPSSPAPSPPLCLQDPPPWKGRTPLGTLKLSSQEVLLMVSQVWLGESRESPFWSAGQVRLQVLGTRAQVGGEDRVRSADGQPPSWAWSSCLRGPHLVAPAPGTAALLLRSTVCAPAGARVCEGSVLTRSGQRGRGRVTQCPPDGPRVQLSWVSRTGSSGSGDFTSSRAPPLVEGGPELA